jgi:orotate phosphoribosyltransferase-like protein
MCKVFASRVNNKNCFILDDGSCSGDSLIQMIDEIAFLQRQRNNIALLYWQS